MTALWLSLADLVTPEPRSPCRPASWRFDHIRAAMLEAGDLITAKEAERRVLVLENPGLRGQSQLPRRFTPACNLSCRARWRPRTGIPKARSASCWRAAAPIPR